MERLSFSQLPDSALRTSEAYQMLCERPMDGPLLLWFEPDAQLYDTARHEAMHGLMRPDALETLCVIPSGSVRGFAVFRDADDAMAAAGIVHGDGYGSDLLGIRARAILRGENPDAAVSTAVSQARARLSHYSSTTLDLVARGICEKKVVDGQAFRLLLSEAIWEDVWQQRFPDISLDHFFLRSIPQPEQNEIADGVYPAWIQTMLSSLPDDGVRTVIVTGEHSMYAIDFRNNVWTGEITLICPACRELDGHHAPTCQISSEVRAGDAPRDFFPDSFISELRYFLGTLTPFHRVALTGPSGVIWSRSSMKSRRNHLHTSSMR